VDTGVRADESPSWGVVENHENNARESTCEFRKTKQTVCFLSRGAKYRDTGDAGTRVAARVRSWFSLENVANILFDATLRCAGPDT
jgi:hypothetical protein